MSTTMQPNANEEQGEESVSESPLVRALTVLRRSLVLDLAILGTLLVAIGASPLVSGVYAGMFGVWGATAIICAGLGFVGVQVLTLFDQDE